MFVPSSSRFSLGTCVSGLKLQQPWFRAKFSEQTQPQFSVVCDATGQSLNTQDTQVFMTRPGPILHCSISPQQQQEECRCRKWAALKKTSRLKELSETNTGWYWHSLGCGRIHRGFKIDPGGVIYLRMHR